MNLGQILGFYNSKRTEGVSSTTYGTPKKVCTATDIAVAHAKVSQTVYESGVRVHDKVFMAGTKVTLTSHTMPLADKLEMGMGITDPEASGGYEIGSDGNTSPSYYAIGWPTYCPVDGVDGYVCQWYYKAMMSPPDESYKSATEQGYQFSPEAYEFSCIRDQHTGRACRMQYVNTLTEVDEFFAAVMPAASYTTVGAAVYDVTAPVKSATPQATHDAGTGYTAAITWSPTGETFAESTVYTATVVLTAASGYIFALGFADADVQGLPASGYSEITVTRNSATQVTIAVVYSATAA